MKYRKKSEVVEAMEYTGINGREIQEWSENKVIESPVLEKSLYNPSGCYLQIDNPQARIRVAVVTDYIIKDEEGNYWPIPHFDFEKADNDDEVVSMPKYKLNDKEVDDFVDAGINGLPKVTKILPMPKVKPPRKEYEVKKKWMND